MLVHLPLKCLSVVLQEGGVPFRQVGALNQAIVFLSAAGELVNLLLHDGARLRVARDHAPPKSSRPK